MLIRFTEQYITGITPDTRSKLTNGSRHFSYMLVVFFASLSCTGLSIYLWGVDILYMILAAYLPALLVEILFTWIQKKSYRGGSFVMALLLILLLPTSTPLWMISLAAAFGTLIGKEIFGGTGFQLVSPVLLAKLFLMISYLPDIQGEFLASLTGPSYSHGWKMAGLMMGATLILLILLNRSNLFILAGLVAGTGLALAWQYSLEILPYDNMIKILMLDSFAFVTCFIIFDPATSPASRWSKIIYGFIAGALGLIIGTFSDRYNEGIIIAVLFVALLTPLLDLLMKNEKSGS